MIRKLIVSMVLLVFTLAAQAQFEEGKWLITPSTTGLGFSYSGHEKTKVAFQMEAGSFLADNVALLINAGVDYTDNSTDLTTVGAGGRYYIASNGIYLGANLKYYRYDFAAGGRDNDASLGAEVGYAFFLNGKVTVEPAIYYNQSLTDHDYNKVGLKIGFGFYF